MKYAILSAIVTYATACAFGNMYLIRLQDSIYQSGTLFSIISASCSSVMLFPFLTRSMMVKESCFGTPLEIR